MFTRRLVLGAALAAGSLALATGAHAQAWKAKYPELVLAVVPAENASGVTERYGPFVEYLSKELGTKVILRVANDYAAVIEGQRNGSIQIAGYGPASYARAVVTGVKVEPFATTVNNDGTIGYYSVFYVRGEEGRDGLRVTVRAFPRKVPSPGALGLPDELSQALTGTGLWVVAGGAGQGTSTTVAALVQHALERRPLEVCMLESPPDYLLEPMQGLVQQVEIGVQAPTFAAALEDARRTDADLVVVGQLDDASTLEAAVSLAARGRLVLGVLHAKTALVAAQKLVELSPPSGLPSVLRGLFAQSLLPKKSGGRSLCWELLPGTELVRQLLRDRAVDQLAPLLSPSADQSLLKLVLRGEVDPNVALTVARDRPAFEAQLSSRAA